MVVTIKRISRLENRYHKNMGAIKVRVTRVKKKFLGVPVKTIHEYRETYHGKVKDCKDCDLALV